MANALSRRFEETEAKVMILTMVSIPSLTQLEELRQLYLIDSELQGLL